MKRSWPGGIPKSRLCDIPGYVNSPAGTQRCSNISSRLLQLCDSAGGLIYPLMFHNLLSEILPWAHSLMYLTLMFPKKSQECVLAGNGNKSQKSCVWRCVPMTATVPTRRNAVLTAEGINAAPPSKVNIRGWGVLCNISLGKCAYHVGWGLTAALQVWIRLATFLHVFLPLILLSISTVKKSPPKNP